ncbi:ras-related protein rab-5c [Anaeramoeba ignava]|uniref:Ras-related protein rab-5c n=1 Tax=Anaeramoeba ignava TaxID=1746090 RepID=A0A9Q0L5W7_ANAIG|nr:ras-related protein rab-5c [Anaeramoeba ignava]
MDSDSKLSFKVVLLGHSHVGKTCLVKKLITGEFDPETETTINATYSVYDVEFEKQTVQLQIWDTAGEEKFQKFAPIYYHGAFGALVIYDITDNYSFTRAKFWINELYRNGSPDVIIILVGNKLDRESERTVNEEEVQKYADENSLYHIQSSAKTGENVADSFRALAKKILESKKLSRNNIRVDDDDDDNLKKKKQGCC